MTKQSTIKLSGKVEIEVGDKEIHIHKVENKDQPTSAKEQAGLYTKLGAAFTTVASLGVGLTSKFSEAAYTDTLMERYNVLLQGLTEGLVNMPTVGLDTAAFLIPFALTYHHMRNKNSNMAVAGTTGFLTGGAAVIATEAFITDPIRDILIPAML